MGVFLSIAAIGKLPITTVKFTFERLFPCMSAFVDLEVLGAREDLAAARERAGEGLLTGVHADVVDELVLGLEGLALARTVLPKADVAALFRPPTCSTVTWFTSSCMVPKVLEQLETAGQ